MSGKPVRFGLLIVGLLITAALAYRAVDNEVSLGRAYRQSVAHNNAAGQALEALLDLRGSLHAYVAPGQGVPFWSRRSEQLLVTLRESLATLDAAMATSGGSLAETLAAVDQLAAAERRTREYARRGETLLAGDVVFTEARDLLTASVEQIQSARTTLAAANDSRVASLRREQAILVSAAAVSWIVIAVLLLPPAKAEPVKDPGAWRDALAQTIKKPLPKEPERTRPVEPVEPVQRLEPVVPLEPSVPLRSILEVSEICSDMSSLADTGALSGVLERAAAAINATGVIVWIASDDGNTLSPVASHGFDEKLVTRIGRIARDSANLTAMAFRENVPRVSAATSTAPAALAVSLCGPTGPVGVLSVELKPDMPADEARVALATIFAAQLATLVDPIPAAPAAADAPDAPDARARRVEEAKHAAL